MVWKNKPWLLLQWHPCFYFVSIVYWRTEHFVIVWDHILWEKFEDTIGWKQNEYVYRRRIDNIMTKWRSTKNIILVKYWYSMGTWTILVTKINLILWNKKDNPLGTLELWKVKQHLFLSFFYNRHHQVYNDQHTTYHKVSVGPWNCNRYTLHVCFVCNEIWKCQKG